LSRKDKAIAKANAEALQQALDTFIEGEQGGEPVKGRKHTFSMKKEVDKLKDKNKK
jgi:hypothetical protein